MKFVYIIVMGLFITSCSVLNPSTLKKLQLEMCVSTVKHYEQAIDEIEANAYHAHFAESCLEKHRVMESNQGNALFRNKK